MHAVRSTFRVMVSVGFCFSYRSVTEFEFEFECSQNPTIFSHLNPLDVQRQVSVAFEFSFALRNSKLFLVPSLQKSHYKL